MGVNIRSNITLDIIVSNIKAKDMKSYGINPPQYVTLRDIPSKHFTQKLTKTQENITFLPGISIALQQDLNYTCYVKTTSVDIEQTEAYQQLSACFDISCRPIGSTLAKPLLVNFSKDSFCNYNPNDIVLLSFDNRTRSWIEHQTVFSENGINVEIHFFGKFCLCYKPAVTRYVLTEVATSHEVHNCGNYSCVISVENDTIDQFGAVLTMAKTDVSSETQKRVADASGVHGISVNTMFNFETSGNRKTAGGIKITYQKHNENKPTDEPRQIIGLYRKNNIGVWNVFGSQKSNTNQCIGEIGVGVYKVVFLEIDSSTSNDLNRQQFFATELEYAMNSSKASVYIYQHVRENNRIHIGFNEKPVDEWKLIGTNKDIILEEHFTVDYTVHGATILEKDNSIKKLLYYNNNKTGIDFYIYRTKQQMAESSCCQVEIKIAKSPYRVAMGTILCADVDLTNSDQFKPYVQEKQYSYVNPPEIYPEYKLQWIKNLSPLERDKFKHINGI